MQERRHGMVRVIWWSSNPLLAAAFVAMPCSRVGEYSVRRHLDGFSDAIVPNTLPAEPKVEAVLNGMRAEPSRAIATNQDALAKRGPEMTLTYRQLLNVDGTTTNAFLSLRRSSDLRLRRRLLLSPDRGTRDVTAEVLMDERWIIVDPSYRVIMKDTRGHNLTRSDQRNEARDSTRFLERDSFYYLVLCAAATFYFLFLRALLAWYADCRLRMPRFHLLTNAIRAGAVFFSAPETKQ